jgi:transposase
MKSKRYDAEFKKEIAQLYLSGSRTGPSLAAELGLHPNTIYKWAQELEEDPEAAFPGSGNLKPEDQAMKKAQQRIKELENEVAILKQAAAYFAKNCR